jgi:hypothetical protein
MANALSTRARPVLVVAAITASFFLAAIYVLEVPTNVRRVNLSSKDTISPLPFNQTKQVGNLAGTAPLPSLFFAAFGQGECEQLLQLRWKPCVENAGRIRWGWHIVIFKR